MFSLPHSEMGQNILEMGLPIKCSNPHGIYVVLPMLFPMLKGANLGKAALFCARSSLCAWDELHKHTG